MVNDLFKGMHQHTVCIAIADLAASSLLTYAVDDSDELWDPSWAALVDEIRDEMRASILAHDDKAADSNAHFGSDRD